MLELIAINIIASLGVAILLVDRGDTWPVVKIRDFLVFLLRKINKKLPDMFDCMICTGFWASLVVDGLLFVMTKGIYFAWPISGLSTVAIIWFVNEFLNAIDHEEIKHDE